jgi:hypothetical protein
MVVFRVPSRHYVSPAGKYRGATIFTPMCYYREFQLTNEGTLFCKGPAGAHTTTFQPILHQVQYEPKDPGIIMVDYSKWDRFEDSSDDDEDEDRLFSPPRVTRLDAPSTITTQVDGTIRIRPSQEIETAAPAAAARRPPAAAAAARTTILAPPPPRGEQPSRIQPPPHNAAEEEECAAAVVVVVEEKIKKPTSSIIPAQWTAQGSRGRLLLVVPKEEVTGNEDRRCVPADDGDDDDDEKDLSKFYFWSQDRDTVTLRIPLPAGGGGGDTTTTTVQNSSSSSASSSSSSSAFSYTVQLTAPLSYRDRHLSSLAVPGSQRLTIDQSPKRLSSSSTGNNSDNHNNNIAIPDDNGSSGGATTSIRLLDQVLAYAVHLAEDDDDNDNTVDWSILPWPSIDDDHYKVLIITLYKATPMLNVHVWWQRLFVDEMARDEAHDPMARQHQKVQFQTMWEQAHEQFRANIINKNNK